ncbi:MAG: DUF1080 domain-containing protein [Planctomycetia bacterium]|nr:DUF1080 domain-containing protein [Planctomycetia bacterium]
MYCLSLFSKVSFIVCFWAFYLNHIQAETVLERTAKLPFIPFDQKAIDGFDSYGGNWLVDQEGILTGKIGENGPRLVSNNPEISAKRGEFEVEIRIPERKNGFSGVGFKVSDCGIGADNYNGYEVSFNPEEQILLLGAHRHNFQSLQRIPREIPINQWFRVRIRFDEYAFQVWINDELAAQFEEPEKKESDPLRQGTILLRTWNYDIQFRNFRFRSFDSQPDLLDEAALSQIAWTSLPFVTPAEKVEDFPETLSLENVPPFLVLVRSMLTNPNSVGNDIWMSRPKEPGCSIRLIDPSQPAKEPFIVFDDPNGSIYDMNLSYDAQTIYFSYCPENESYWNIWSIQIDGTHLIRLTDGPYFDVSPCELPNGDLIFVSTRRFGHTVCQPGPSSNLFRMKKDGSEIQCVSMNTLSDLTPQMLPDGRVLFTRWEYVDRDLTYRQSLWTQNPDGTVYQLYFGNTVRDVGTFWEARPLPDSGSSRVVATFAPHHGYPHGAIGIIDRQFGVEGEKGISFRYITKEFPVIADSWFEWAYRDPFPLADDLFLCSFGNETPTVFTEADGVRSGPRYKIWLLDDSGEKRLIYEDPKAHCFFPIPLEERERPPLVPSRLQPQNRVKFRPTLTQDQVLTQQKNDWGIPEKTDLLNGEPAGIVTLMNVYNGIEPWIQNGQVKSIRIMEQIRKTEDLVNRAYDQSPVMSYGTYYAKRNWGTVPVDEDGSAHFYVPALREIYFQILDSEGRELHRMTSAVQLMPGESLSCHGCHEPRMTIPGTANEKAHRPSAAQRSPSLPILPEWMLSLPYERTNKTLDAGIVDYPSVVQPVWDQYCISCHSGADPAGGYDLTGDKTRFFSVSYDHLLGKSRSYRQHNMLTGEMTPDEAQKEKPLVHFYWLLFTPSAVHQPGWSGTFASRLSDYLTKEHCGQEMSQEAKERVWLWIDSNVPYYGTYANAKPDSAGRRDRWAKRNGNDSANWMTQDVLPIYEKKCATCHQNLFGGNHDLPGVHDALNIDWTGRFAWINLSQPEHSFLLTTHLPQKEGGRGISTDPTIPDQWIFATKNDPDYQQMLRGIQEGNQEMLAIPEADSPTFQQARPEP